MSDSASAVPLHINDDGTIDSPLGRIGDIGPCVLIGSNVLEWTREVELPLCPQARALLGPGGSARTVGNVMTVESREGQLIYDVYPAQLKDTSTHIGVLRTR